MELTRAVLDPAAITRRVERPAAGAVVVFIGTARDEHEGRRVERLEYEAQERLAQKALERLCAEALSRFDLAAVAIQHRIGKLEIGEASVVIAVSAAHRAAAFDGCRHLIDTLKTTVPIWKKEYYAGDAAAVWVGPDGKPVRV